MMIIQDRQEQRLRPVTTREHLCRMGWDQIVNDGGDMEPP
jgi:hypothetical protein